MVEWDRSHDWVLLRTQYEIACLSVKFRTSPPSEEEVEALRSCLPRYAAIDPASFRKHVLSQLVTTREVSLGWWEANATETFARQATALGLEVVERDRHLVTEYLPFDRTFDAACFDDIQWALVDEMLAAGVPVEDWPAEPRGEPTSGV